jgi:hypothetical protein
MWAAAAVAVVPGAKSADRMELLRNSMASLLMAAAVAVLGLITALAAAPAAAPGVAVAATILAGRAIKAIKAEAQLAPAAAGVAVVPEELARMRKMELAVAV